MMLRVFAQSRTTERHDRQLQPAKRIAPIDQVFADIVTQLARFFLAFLFLVLARAAIEVVLAVTTDQPVIAFAAAQAVITRLAEYHVITVPT